MEKLTKFLDDLFTKYGVSEDEKKECADIINNLGGDLVTEGDQFDAPNMGDDDDEHEAEEDELAFH